MPITPFLKGEKFDSETMRVMGIALEMACLGLRTGDCADDVKQAIAKQDHCFCQGRRTQSRSFVRGGTEGYSIGLQSASCLLGDYSPAFPRGAFFLASRSYIFRYRNKQTSAAVL